MLGFRPGPRRRQPHPFDAKLAGTGLMLGRPRGDDGRPGPQLVTTETDDLNRVAPTDYGYSAQSPEAQRTQPYDDFTGGFGLATQGAFIDRRYDHTVNVDLTVPGLWLKGPDVVPFTPATTDATNGVSGFFDLAGSTYALAGRYVLKRASDASWTVSKDLNDYGAGTVALDAVTFYSNALAAELAWVALSPASENFAHFDGTTWTQATGATMEARAFAVVGREFYRARDTNFLTKCDTDADPTVEANWNAANAFRIGDKSSAITRLYVNAAGVLVVVKTDGIYSLASDGQDIRYFPFLDFAPSADNGKGGGAFLNDLYLPFRQGLYRLTPDFALQEAGPEQQNGTRWLSGMRTTAFQGHDTLSAYAAVTDESDGYLMQLLPSGVWHGSVSVRFVGKRITALWKSAVGAPAFHARLYLGFSDGTLGWLVLANGADPSADSDYRFSTADGVLVPPVFTGGVPNDPKVFYELVVNGRNLSANNYVTVGFQDNPSFTGYYDIAGAFADLRTRRAFPDATGAVLMKFAFTLVSTSTASSPEVTGAGVVHAWRPDRREVYLFSVLCEDGLTRWDNTPLRIGRTRILAVVEGARDTVGSVVMVLPDHGAKQVTLTRVEQTTAFDDRTRQWRAAVAVRAIAFGDIATTGTYERWGDLTYDQWDLLTYDQWEDV